jgi:hypothetical protein
MKTAMRSITLLALAMMGTDVSSAAEAGSTGRQIPEYVITKPARQYCELAITLPAAAPDAAENRLFDFMDAANAYTKGWRTGFAVVGVNYVTNTSLDVISFTDCAGSGAASAFVVQFVEDWRKRHCVEGCEVSKPHIAARPRLDFAIPYAEYAFRSQIDEFLHYQQRESLSGCTLEIDLAPSTATNFPRTALFGAVMSLQRKFRYPVLDISQINRKLYILLSRQCPDKEALYESMLRNLVRQGVSVDALRSVNFHPNVSDYLYSQTGLR